MSNRTRLFLRTSVSLGVMVAIAGNPARVHAQELEEIVVTARKRAQNIQDVPLPIQAFDNAAIREKGLRDFEDYAKELTSVSFGTSSPGATTIAFRGALSQPTGFDTISSSTLYLDEIPITRDGQNADVRLIDIERVEALSGPQPTLYGAGSQSGTLKIVTNKPDTSGFGGWLDVGAGSTKGGEESYDISGAINIPLIDDKLAIRLVGFYEEEGGYIDNVLGTTSDYSPTNGDRDNADLVEDDINDYTGRGGRAFVRYQPNEDWTFDAGVVYQYSELDNLFDYNPAFGDLNTIKFKEERDIDEWHNLSLTIEGDLGFASLTFAAGFHDRRIDYDIDATAYMTQYKENGLALAEYYTGYAEFLDYDTCAATAYCYLFVNYNDFGPDPTATVSLDQRVKSYAQEIRLTSKEDEDSRFSWLIGTFYERTNNDWDYITVVDDFAENGGGGSIFTYYGVEPTDVWFDQGFREGRTYNGFAGNDLKGQRQDIESFAVFGEVSFDITDTITVTGGGRWFSTDFRTIENSLFVDMVSENFDVTETTEEFSPRFNISWRPTDDFLGYLTYSEGVRIGGRNGGVAQMPASVALGAPETFDADRLINYEAGIKSTWAEGRLLANVSAFAMDWEDYQIRVTLPIAGPTTVNAGNASIDGVEGQFAFKLTDALEISTAFTYLDARVDDDILLNNGTIVAGEAGDPLPAVPEWKIAAGVQYDTELPWAGMEGYARFDVSHVGESVNGTTASVSLFGASTTIPAVQPEYQLGDLSFGVRSDSGWEAWIAINNVWDERAITYIWPRFGDDRVFTVRPREIRVGFYKDF
ncbi:MAG: TonB-dependent receptor [Pseudomonadota bacterium]